MIFFIHRTKPFYSERSDSKNLLPSSMAVLHDKYTVTRVLPISKKQKFTLEDRFHLHAVSFKSKNEALLSGYLSLRGSHTCLDNSVSVDESNPIVRGSELLQVFFKVHLTPQICSPVITKFSIIIDDLVYTNGSVRSILCLRCDK